MSHYILDANVSCGHKTMVSFEITNIYHTVYMHGYMIICLILQMHCRNYEILGSCSMLA